MALMILVGVFVFCGIYNWTKEISMTCRYTKAWRKELDDWQREQERQRANVRRARVQR